MAWNYKNIWEHLPALSILRNSWSEYQDVSSTHKISIRGNEIGGPKPVIIAGPCAVESVEQTRGIAKVVKERGIHMMRGGAFKPRTNPNEFQGLGLEGLKILREIREEFNLAIVTEVMDPRMVEVMTDTVDMFQIGSRSMYNYPLLKEVGKANKPVLLKRAWCATLEEWLCSAEYIAKEGNRNIALCERGIRTSVHGSYARCILDLNVIEPLRHLTPLPIVVDPSHATGQWSLVPAMAEAGIVAGAHGLLLEVVLSESSRSNLRCDHEQGISPEQLSSIAQTMNNLTVRPFRHD